MVRAVEAKKDPRLALRSLLEQLLGEPLADGDGIWYETNHEDYGFETMVSIYPVAEFADVGGAQQELSGVGRVRPTPQEAERAAAHFMLERLEDHIQWE